MRKVNKPKNEADGLLKTTAETIGSTLGRLIAKTGLVKAESTPPKKTRTRSTRKSSGAKPVASHARRKPLKTAIAPAAKKTQAKRAGRSRAS